MSWVRACAVLMSHSVAVVSIEQVTMDSVRIGFQEKEVMGGRLICGDLLCILVQLIAVTVKLHSRW